MDTTNTAMNKWTTTNVKNISYTCHRLLFNKGRSTQKLLRQTIQFPPANHQVSVYGGLLVLALAQEQTWNHPTTSNVLVIQSDLGNYSTCAHFFCSVLGGFVLEGLGCVERQKIAPDRMTGSLVSCEELAGQRGVQRGPSLCSLCAALTGAVSLRESGR